MASLFEGLPFRPADILLPQGCDMSCWSVVACDQYTSQPEYWKRVEDRVGKKPSAYHLILPESRLGGPDVAREIQAINTTMEKYLQQDLFRCFPDSLIYLERTQRDGRIRRGLVGMIDLEAYDFTPGSQTMIRATEGTVLSRIPPRVAVRRHAPLELPHVMLLADDRENVLLGPMAQETARMECCYDFELMEQSGHVKGWLLGETQKRQAARCLRDLAEPEAYRARYGLDQAARPMLFAVGDGNHSLATAKACWEQIKADTPDWAERTIPARYALAEVCSLYDDALTFEPIHRVVFRADPEGLLEELKAAFPGACEGEGEGHRICYSYAGRKGCITVPKPEAQLAVGTLQNFLDEFLARHPGAGVDYVHGAAVAEELAESADRIAFLLPPMDKMELFPTVIRDGVLPRKTFSMGEAHDKRFYLEARAIRG